MPTPQKEAILQETSTRLAGVKGVFLADLSGMTVEKVTLLRKKCREQKVQVRVVKNTLLKRAFNAHGITALDEFLVGPTGLGKTMFGLAVVLLFFRPAPKDD